MTHASHRKRSILSTTWPNGIASGAPIKFVANSLPGEPADATWACDFIQTYDIIFRQVYAFFIVHMGSRKAVYAAACRTPPRRCQSSLEDTRNWAASLPIGTHAQTVIPLH